MSSTVRADVENNGCRVDALDVLSSTVRADVENNGCKVDALGFGARNAPEVVVPADTKRAINTFSAVEGILNIYDKLVSLMCSLYYREVEYLDLE